VRIGMILREKYPPDIRVDKEIRMLREGGHQLFLLCYGAEGRTGDEVREDGVTIRSIQPHPRRWQRHLDNWRFCFAFRSVLLECEIARFLDDYAIEAVHVHDLPLVGPTLRIAKPRGLPVVADLHENYPSAVQNYYDSRLKKRLLYAYHRWARYEQRVCQQADAVLCVIDEFKDRLIVDGAPEANISVVTNCTHPEFAERSVDSAVIDEFAGRFVVTYIGSVNTNRDIETLIDAVALLKPAIPNILLLVIGPAPEWHLSRLVRRVEQRELGDCVRFDGWRDFATIHSYMAASQVCTLPLRPSVHAHASGPHKLFQYAMMAKPIVLNDCRSLARMASESGCALVARSRDPESLAACIQRIHDDPELAASHGAKGAEWALHGPYSWEQTAATLGRVYASLR